jgi:hypothetical protein
MEYILTNFMLYVRGNFKNVAIHLHSALIFLKRLDQTRKASKHLYVNGGISPVTFAMR